jgi:hypothetical protein
MTSEKINLTPPLEMGKATSWWIKKALKHSNEPKPTSLSKILIKVESKIIIWLQKLMKRETTKQKGKPLGETLKKIPKAILMSSNLKNTSTCQTSLPKTSCKN